MMEEGEEREMDERVHRLSDLQQQLLCSLISSGLTREVLVQAISELERERNHNRTGTVTGSDRMEVGDRTDGESSEDGENDFPPPIFREIEKLPPEEAARQRAEVEQLLQEDPWRVAKVVKSYMQQHNLPQREVVESTGLNQSHLSQHLNKGTPMKNQKRAALYSWYVKKQDEINQQFTNASRGLVLGEEPSEENRKGRRNRFKWGPASQQILFQAYDRQKNPSKEEREGLVEECNRAECLQRGVSPSQLAGLGSNLVTEVRVYNWFANRRKEEAFRHKLALDPPYNSQSASSTEQIIPSPTPVRVSGNGDRADGGTGMVQLESSLTLLESHQHKTISGGSLPPVSTLTSLHGVAHAHSSSTQGLIMASLPSVMSLGDSSLLIGLTSAQPQTVPVINNVGGGFTTLQPITFQQQLHTSTQQPITQQIAGHMGHSPFMTTMTPLPCHMYSKADLTSYQPSSILTQAMVIAESNSIGNLTSLTTVRQTLNSDAEEQDDPPIQEELHLSGSPTPGHTHDNRCLVSSGSLDLYPQSPNSESHSSHMLTSSPGDISPYIPAHMVSTAQ